jgi:hypothetical protein
LGRSTRVLGNSKLPPPLNFTFNWDVDDVDDVDVVADDADDDDVDEMREKFVIRLPKRTTRGISQNIGPAQSKRTFPGSTSVLAVYIYIPYSYAFIWNYIHIHMILL